MPSLAALRAAVFALSAKKPEGGGGNQLPPPPPPPRHGARFLKNRFIGENTRIIYDILWDAYKDNKKGMLLSVDFKTAFDVMSWKFTEKNVSENSTLGTSLLEPFGACIRIHFHE